MSGYRFNKKHVYIHIRMYIYVYESTHIRRGEAVPNG